MFLMKFLLPVSLIIFLGNSFLKESETVSDNIAWDENYDLTWDDFKGSPEHSSGLDAYTMLGLSLEVIDQNNGNVDMGVFGYFEKNKSWVKPNEKTDYLLHHEMRHFDLCELYRRKLIKNLEEGKYTFDGFSNEVGKIFNQTFDDYTKEQARYDKETNHSQKKEIQKKWDKFITKELLRLKKYDKIAASLKVS